MGYIYMITNKIDGKKYIGQTIEKDINERWKNHFKKSSNCRYLKSALNKYEKGNFQFDIICICFDSDCDKYENEYMKKYNTISPNGYNLREAGNNGPHNQETKTKIANTVSLYYSKLTDEEKGKYKEKYSGSNNYMFGKKHSDESKEKMRKNIKRKKKVNCYNLENELICTFESIMDACRVSGGNHRNISSCCKGITKTCKGFIWKFYENNLNTEIY
jgi:group I intron endonuclease